MTDLDRIKVRRIGLYALILLVLAATLLPILWMVATSVKPAGEYVSKTPTLLPHAFTLEHYQELWKAGFLRRLANTLMVAFGATLLSLVIGFLAAYALTRFHFPGRLDTIFLVWVLVIKMVPPIVIAIPLFQVLRTLGLLNTLMGLIVVYQVYTLPYCIWMLLGFVRDVPIELEEAAAIDGASLLQGLSAIVVPLAGPGIVATAIFSVIMAWNEFLYALLFLQTPSLFTLPIHISNFITENETLWGQLMGIGLLSSLPILLVASYIQKYLLRGFAMGLK